MDLCHDDAVKPFVKITGVSRAATLRFQRAMRFCPKCSLKIKAAIDRCPICKVELLSCAEDEEVRTPLSQRGETPHMVIDTSPAPSVSKDHAPRKTATPQAEEPDPVQSTAPPAEDLTVLARKLKSLEDHLLHIEKTIEIDASKDEIIRSSIVDLESKINKVEKTLAGLEAFSHDRLKKLEAEIARLSPNGTAPPLNSDRTGRGSTPFESRPETSAPYREIPPSGDFSFRETGFPKEEMSFSDSREGDFEGTFSSPPLGDEFSSRKRKRKLPVLLPLIALLLIFIWLAFYYSKPHKQDVQEALLAEKIVPPSPSTAGGIQPDTDITVKTAEGGESAEEAVSALTPPSPEEETAPPPPQSPPAAPDTGKSGGYTVNVGAFTDKDLALRLTTRLREKGYAAIMSPSKDKRFYRVKVGAFATKQEARDFASILEKKEKLPTFVAQINQL